MATLTKTEIERGKVIRLNKLITPLNNNEEIVIYNITYEIDGYKYRFNLNENFNSNELLIQAIYDYLLTVEKKDINNLPDRPDTTIEEVTSLIGQPINEPTRP